MTEQQMRKVLAEYQEMIRLSLINDTDNPRHPRAMEDWCHAEPYDNVPRSTAGRHVMWMCQKVLDHIEDGKLDKANRWLGFIQGYLWCENIRTIHDMRGDNR